MKRTRIAYLDMLRIIACILVVMGHVSAQQIERLPVDGSSFFITNAFNCLAFTGVPLFVMISGALALSQERTLDLKALLVHRTLHFFVIYYIWKALYQVVSLLGAGEAFTFENIKNEIVLALVQQRGFYHLWYLPMIAILYMAVPLIKAGVMEKQVCRYFLCVFFVTALLFPTLFCYEFKFKYLFVSFFSFNDFYFFGGYLGYFILGHYLHSWGDGFSALWRRVLYVLGIGSMILAWVLGAAASIRQGAPSYHMNTPFVVTTFFVSAAVFVAARSLCRRVPSERMGKALSFGASVTLGIYLLHPLAILFFNKIGFTPAVGSPLFTIPLLVLCVVLLCGGVSVIILKIPVLRKLIQ